MGLRWKSRTGDQLANELERSTTVSRRESKRVMRAGAKEVLEASRQMAPIDDGELEAAHELQVVRLNKDDITIEITVGGVVNDVNVDNYAWIQHERLEPFGDLRLGPRSRQKDMSNPPNRRVGGKFLERAIEEIEPEIVAALAKVLPGS